MRHYRRKYTERTGELYERYEGLLKPRYCLIHDLAGNFVSVNVAEELPALQEEPVKMNISS